MKHKTFYIPYKKDVADWYLKTQQNICQDEINSIRNDIKNKKYSGGDPKTLFEFIHCIENSLKTILIGKPNELLKVHNDFLEIYPTAFQKNNPLYNILSKIFNYDNFINAHKGFAYKLTKKLDVCVCPYCNREFIYTVSQPDISDENTETACLIRPELDHYLPKSKYPLLALSFCNLIPSGHICNCNIKLRKELDIGKHLHPYIKSKARIQFSTALQSGIDDDEPNDNPPRSYHKI